jgi:putative aminopeptidase FrvX
VSVDVEFLRNLCTTPGPSGFEGPVQALVRKRAAATAAPEGDSLGNVWADVNPQDTPHVIVVGHADQIGLIVTYVDDDGFIFFDKIGGVAAGLLPARHLIIHSAVGPVDGIVGKPPTHILSKEERSKAPEISAQCIDIGAASREEALKRVSIGDPITFEPTWLELAPDRFAAPAFDDRAGVYTAFRALELYAAMKGRARLTAVSTVHEETTYMGSRAMTYRLQPDVTIVVDGDFDSANPYVDAKKLGGEVKLGGGPILGRGAGSNERLLAMAREVAAGEGIPVQIKAYPSETSTDADEMMAAGNTATLSLGIAMRYMHSPFEVAAGEDIEMAARLVAALAKHVGEVFTPGCFVP